MKPEPNFFYVNRSLLNSDRWLSETFTRGQAWIDLFGLANHKEGYVRVRGMKIPLKRGQLGWSQESLSARWNWSRGKVKRYLNELENEGDIVQQTSSKITIITIKKYDYWQGDDGENGTTDGHQTVQQTDTNKNNKNNKNIKINIANLIELIDWWNKELGTNFKATPKLQNNFDYWHKIYTLEQIKMAAKLAKTKDVFWNDKITPTKLLRTKNQNGDACDHIGDMLNKYRSLYELRA